MERAGLLALSSYNAYANELLLHTAGQVPDIDLKRELSPSHGSVFNLLRHMLVAEAFFLADCQGRTLHPSDLPHATLNEVRASWSLVSREMHDYIASSPQEEIDRVVEVTMREHTFQFPTWQLLTQAIFHSTHHRGELSILLTGLGYPLPTLDIIIQFAQQSGQPWPW